MFVPGPAAASVEAVERYASTLCEEAALQGAELGTPRGDDDDWDAKLALLHARRPAVASFTFGCPSASWSARSPPTRARR